MTKRIAVIALVGLLLHAPWLPVPTGGLSIADEDQLLPVDVRSAEIDDQLLPVDVQSAEIRDEALPADVRTA